MRVRVRRSELVENVVVTGIEPVVVAKVKRDSSNLARSRGSEKNALIVVFVATF